MRALFSSSAVEHIRSHAQHMHTTYFLVLSCIVLTCAYASSFRPSLFWSAFQLRRFFHLVRPQITRIVTACLTGLLSSYSNEQHPSQCKKWSKYSSHARFLQPGIVTHLAQARWEKNLSLPSVLFCPNITQVLHPVWFQCRGTGESTIRWYEENNPEYNANEDEI